MVKKKKKKMPANARDMGSIRGVRNGNPLAWKIPGGAWWVTVHGVSKSWTQLSTHTHTHTQSVSHY